ncbi:MAG: tRNA (adenosine(37)-N6)-threonylcarbamoyltransferase complex dimerization subunit type 1 TsaB [Chloroflexota bacterium]|nr:tRNA (adenosine(37)-N6)-threonylcarbamoyltransferase complex dimerization subunit type 1 TsaB [Chloroflexota bacterium]
MNGIRDGLILVVDTSTRSSIVAVGGVTPVAVSRRDVQHRHGSHVLEQIDEVMAEAGISLDDVTGLVVGTGPGSFTGLRVGMATVKTIAYARGLRVVGVVSTDALRRAVGTTGVAPDAAVVLRAGARDHYLARLGADPVLIAPDGLEQVVHESTMIAIDMDADVLGEEAAELGATAVEGLPAALLSMAHERLEAGDVDDPAELTPAYVALPRGVKRAAEELGWSPDLR